MNHYLGKDCLPYMYHGEYPKSKETHTQIQNVYTNTRTSCWHDVEYIAIATYVYV